MNPNFSDRLLVSPSSLQVFRQTMGLPAWIEINGNRGELVEPWRGSVAERWTPYAVAKALGIDRHTAAKYVTAIAD